MENYIVYIHINKINNKKYIGITKQNPETRWGKNGSRYQDSPLFYNAIQKYGWNNFEHIILYKNLTQQQACKKEQELIAKYKTNNDKFGYNLTSGGEKHYVFTEEVKEKIRQSQLGSKNSMFGTHRTLEQKVIQSEKMSGGKNPAAKKVLCIETNIIYDCCRDAANILKLGPDKITGGKNISRCASGKRPNAYKLHWRYVE